MTPIEIACRYSGRPNGITLFVCGAQAGEPCLDTNRKPCLSFHAERISDAAVMSSSSKDEMNKNDFDKAVEDTDLI